MFNAKKAQFKDKEKREKRPLPASRASNITIEQLQKEILPLIEESNKLLEPWENLKTKYADYIQKDKDIHRAYDVAEQFLEISIAITKKFYWNRKKRKKTQQRQWKRDERLSKSVATIMHQIEKMKKAMKDVNVPEFTRQTDAARRSINTLLTRAERYTREGLEEFPTQTRERTKKKLYDPEKHTKPDDHMEAWRLKFIQDQGIRLSGDQREIRKEIEESDKLISRVTNLKHEKMEDEQIPEPVAEEESTLDRARRLYREKHQEEEDD